MAQKEGTLQEVLMFHIDRTDRMHPNRVWYADVYKCMQYTPFKTHPVTILSWLYYVLLMSHSCPHCCVPRRNAPITGANQPIGRTEPPSWKSLENVKIELKPDLYKLDL